MKTLMNNNSNSNTPFIKSKHSVDTVNFRVKGLSYPA